MGLGTFNVIIYALVIFGIAMVFIIRTWKKQARENIRVEVVRSGGDSVKVFGKLVGNMLEIPPNPKYGWEVGKMYPFIADDETKLREATKEDKSESIGIAVTEYNRQGIYYTDYPEGLPAWMAVGMRKCVVDEDNWEIRTRYGSDPMMNPDIIAIHEHEKTAQILAAASQEINDLRDKLQKALTKHVNPMVIYLGFALSIGLTGFLLFQLLPVLPDLKNLAPLMDKMEAIANAIAELF